MQAFVQINTDTANTKEICEELGALSEVKQLFMLFGEWDVLALVEIESAESLGSFVIDKVRALPGIRATSTQIVAKNC
jgi:DNA-binding Lrp family transcriptional regulator